MKKYSYIFLTLALLFVMSPIVIAQTTPTNPGTSNPGQTTTAPSIPGENDTLQQIVANLIVRGADFIIVFLVGLTVLVFMYGLMKYMFKGASSDTARTEGRKLMLWGLVGIFVMVSVWGLVSILASTIGHESRAVPQFEPNGTFEDGRARTGDQRVYAETVTAVKKTAQERFREFMQGLRQLPQNAARNGRNAIDFMQSLPGRLRGNQSVQPTQPVQPVEPAPTAPTQSQPFL